MFHIGVTERPRSLNPGKDLAMAICPINIFELAQLAHRWRGMWIFFPAVSAAQKQLARTSLNCLLVTKWWIWAIWWVLRWLLLKYLPTCFMAKSTAPSALKPSVRKIVVKFSRGKWSQCSSGGSIKAAKHKLISFRSWPWWMITKANKDIAKRKHTYLFYGNVNCTSKAKACWFPSPKWGVDPTTFYPFASTHFHIEITSLPYSLPFGTILPLSKTLVRHASNLVQDPLQAYFSPPRR